jgi:hypothetical protein
MNKSNHKTAADIKAERIRLAGQVREKEEELMNEIMEVKDKFNPIPNLASLFNSNETKSTRAVVDTGVNLLVSSIIKSRLGFIPSMVTPFVSKTISDQVMKLNAKPYLIQALDWVIDKTEVEEGSEIKKTPVVPIPDKVIERELVVFSGKEM